MKPDDWNFRRASYPHRGAPGAGPAGGVDLKITIPVKTMIISLVKISGEQRERKKLSAVGVT